MGYGNPGTPKTGSVPSVNKSVLRCVKITYQGLTLTIATPQARLEGYFVTIATEAWGSSKIILSIYERRQVMSKLTLEEMKKLPKEEQKALAKRIKGIRQAYKTVNYSAVYSVGSKKLARTTKFSVKEAQALLEAYWQRNWAVKAAVKEFYVKTLPNGEMWLKNPVSGFYISLRYEKDLFSSANQSTGVYCFDSWVALCRNRGVKVCMQFHDEQANPVKIGMKEQHEKILRDSIVKLNERIKLNVPLDIDVQWGNDYASVH